MPGLGLKRGLVDDLVRAVAGEGAAAEASGSATDGGDLRGRREEIDWSQVDVGLPE